MIKQAMILGAGLGTRMKKLTKHFAKPMLPYQGKSLIEHQLSYFYYHGITKIVINTFYLADKLEDFVERLSIAKKIDLYFSRERDLLGTGGGVKKALDILQQEPFFLINCDSLFINNPETDDALKLLEAKWNPELHKYLMTLVKREEAHGYRGTGDFDLTNGKLVANSSHGEYVFGGLSLLDYRVFQTYITKYLELYPTVIKDLINDSFIDTVKYQGGWYHIGDYQAYQEYSLSVEKF